MRQRGFTYLGLLFAIAFIGLLLAKVGEVWQTTLKREREAELLFAGRQYAHAIAAYYEATPGDAKQWPRSFEDLLEDRRGLVLRRHLRRAYPDPFSGKADWNSIRSGEFIVGVYSRDGGKPLKKSGFLPEEDAFATAATYREWQFIARIQVNAIVNQP